MLTFFDQYKGGEYSQNGEAGIIDECLHRMNIKRGLAYEFGAPTKQYCSNIYHLRRFRRVWLDIDPQEEGIIKAELTPENINQYIPPCDVVSFDTDGADYDLFKAWKARADVVVIEINSSFAPVVDHVSREMGASYKSMCELLIEKGYFVICHTGNLIAVDRCYRYLFPEIPDNPVENWALFFQTKWLS